MRNKDTSREVTDALDILKLSGEREYTREEIDRAYRKRAMQAHPDKGGTGDLFLALSKAYETAWKWVERGPDKNKKTDQEGLATNLSVTAALATLYITISKVSEELARYEASIPLSQLKVIFSKIQTHLREDILKGTPDKVYKLLNQKSDELKSKINTIYNGPTPAFSAVVGAAAATIPLSIVALMLVLFPPTGLVLSTAMLIGLVVIPPASGLLCGTCCFFAASSAHKNRSNQQQEMMKIVTMINTLARVVRQSSESSEEDKGLEEENNTTPLQLTL